MLDFTQSVTKNNYCSDWKVSVEGFSSFAYNVLASRFDKLKELYCVRLSIIKELMTNPVSILSKNVFLSPQMQLWKSGHKNLKRYILCCSTGQFPLLRH